jgi:hypothetical protein
MAFKNGDIVTRRTSDILYKVLDKEPGHDIKKTEVEMIELGTLKGETLGFVAASGFVKASKEILQKNYLELCFEKQILDTAIALVQGEIAKL